MSFTPFIAKSVAAKSVLAAAAVAAALGLSAPANAKVNLDVNVGLGSYGYYDSGYPVYPVEPVYHPVHGGYSYDDSFTSCSEGRDVVRWAGFRHVQPLNCGGRRLTYRARQDGETFIVKVSRRSGEIVSVLPAY